jgi:hypothetical protein
LALRDDCAFYFNQLVAARGAHAVNHALDRTRCRDGEQIKISRRIGTDLAMRVPCLTTMIEFEPQSPRVFDVSRNVDPITTASIDCLCRYMMRTQSTLRH